MHCTGYSRIHRRSTALLIADTWRDSLSPDQWYALSEQLFSRGTVLKQGAYKAIVRTEANGRDVLVKRYAAGGAARRLKSIWSRTRARKEFAAAAHILAAGIPTPEPLLLAERRAGGCLPGDSLITIAFVPDCHELRDVFFDARLYSADERLQIAKRFGHLTALIFNAGINQEDYSLNNFLARKTHGGQELFFIDFERVSITRPLSLGQALPLLAKLNRVGREVSDEERLCFLQAFVRARAVPGGPSAEALAREIQSLTITQTRKDIARGRITSLYTHGHYDRIRQDGITGLRRKHIGPDAVPGLLEALLRSDTAALTCGPQTLRLHALALPDGRAEKFWACLSGLIITGLNAELPQALLIRAPQGFVLFTAEGLERCRTALKQDSPQTRFMRTHIPQAFDYVRQHIER